MSRRSKGYDLRDPFVALAAMGSGDTAAEIRSAVQRAVEAGWDFETIWRFIGDLGAHDSVVDAIDSQLTGRL